LRDVVRDPNALQWLPALSSSGVHGAVVVSATAPKPPWWIGYLAPYVRSGDRLRALANTSTASLLLLETNSRFFAFAFGYGRYLLDPDGYEQDFGLKVVLNTVEPDRLTSVDARSFDELTMHTRRDISQGSSFGAFGLDVSRDLVRAVTGPPRDETLGRRATGSDSLSLLSRAQFAELPALCGRLLTAYGSEDYKDRFGWIDHLRRVRDSGLIGRLNELMLEKIRARDLTDMHLAPPEPMPWQRLEGFTFSTRNDDELDPDPRISAYLDTLSSASELDVSDLKGDRVIAMAADSNAPLESWSVFKCIVFETKDGDTLYALTAGEWYAVSASFTEEVIAFASGLPQLELELPGAAFGIAENTYNSDAAAAVDALLLDQQLVVTPTGDRIELCDLLTRQRQLVHVKKRGSSSTLSHLFSQGLVSAELLTREPAFRVSARDKAAELEGGYELVLPAERPERDAWEVGFVVITRSRRESPLTLPFFSLVNLRSAALRLQDLGYRVSVRQVDES
jgi:uncharacterized protein (TIGR04141 family)